MLEPIKYFLENSGFDLDSVNDYVIGDKYVGIMLHNGNIGVCATLGQRVSNGLFEGEEPDPGLPSHRIILNAWFNAIHNYERQYDHLTDIFDSIDFREYRRVVMIGFFESLFEKFRRDKIKVEIFDLQKESSVLLNPDVLESTLDKADAVILTGTTIFNNTFTKVLAMTPADSNVFLLGPSNILSEKMFGYRNIKLIFGSVFEPYDKRVFDKIRQGHGTRGFLEFLKKVYIATE